MSISSANGFRAFVVLVVEDEFVVRYGTANALREAGYAVVECGSGEEAVALCRSKASIDVLFTDINLGGSVSGWEVAERFRMDRPDGVVLYTSGNGIDPKRCCPDSVFLAKPYLPRRHLERLRGATCKVTLSAIALPLAKAAPA